MPEDLEPQRNCRSTLLIHNAGIWEGQFVRLDPGGREQSRFASHLSVLDTDGLIEASLTNRDSGEVRRMAFREPPAEMQISPQGHWSLGPDRIGPWPWVNELCLVHGDQHRRRRFSSRHHLRLLRLLRRLCGHRACTVARFARRGT